MKNRTALQIAVFQDGRSQTEIARLAHINRSALSRVISGKRKPRLETSLKIASVLGCTPEALGLFGLSSIAKGASIENV
jgi:transcriptional regulator with XRE-family HTH domain